MFKSTSRKLLSQPIVWIMLLAIIIGLGNPFFDHPLAFSVGDEFESQRVSLLILKTQNFRHFSTYLPLWPWLQLPFLAISVLFLLLFRIFPSVNDIGRTLVLSSPGMFLFIPRIMSAVISGLSVWFIYRLGLRLQSRKFGLILTLLYTTDFFRVLFAHFGRYNSLYLFCSLGLLWSLTEWRVTGQLNKFLLSITFLSLSVAAFPMGLALGVFWLIAVVTSQKFIPLLKQPRVWLTALINLVFILGLLYLTPGIIQWHLHNNYAGQPVNLVSLWSQIIFYLQVLLSYQGPIIIIGLIGLIIMAYRKTSFFWLISLFTVSGFAVYLFKAFLNPRSAQPLSLLFIFGTAYLVNLLLKKPFWLAGWLLILTLGYSLILDVRLNYLFFQPSTYVLAKHYLQHQIPNDQPILINRNNIYLVPDLQAQKPTDLYQTDYYQTLKPYLQALTPTDQSDFPNIKQVTSANNLEYLNQRQDLDRYFQAQNYRYIVIDYFTPEERQTLWHKYNLNQTDYPLISEQLASPSPKSSIPDLLDMNYPLPQLFAIDRFGPNFEIYENHQFTNE